MSQHTEDTHTSTDGLWRWLLGGLAGGGIILGLLIAAYAIGYHRGQHHPRTAAPTALAPTTTTTTGPPATSAPKGNATAGKALFTANGCSACHTFTPAAATGTIGPDLDNLTEYAQKGSQPLDQFVRSAIVSPPAPYVPPGFQNVMPTTLGTSLTPQQISDLVAFLTQGH